MSDGGSWEEAEQERQRLALKNVLGWAGGFIRHRWTATGHEIRLGARNLVDRDEPAVGTVPAVVSMTSYGKRLRRTAYLALESIARGSVRPSRLILWVDEPDVIADPPQTLRRLMERGVEILPCEDHGPHKKYYPYVASREEHDLPLVTADDDVIYPYRWLEQIWRVHEQHPEDIIAMRAHRVRLQGKILTPYLTWHPVRSTQASHRHFATGVSGVLHPPRMLEALKESGLGFVEKCPKADDIWLHWHSLRTGTRVRQVHNRPQDFREIERPWQTGLFESNGYGGANDAQINALYTPEDIAVMVADIAR
ncbi:MAG: hypothetical protein ACTHXO_07080 [Actinomycetaceae bacterium]